MPNKKEPSFRKFYNAATAFWLVSLFIYLMGTYWLGTIEQQDKHFLFIGQVLGIIKIYSLFLIPTILVLSLGIRFFEYLLNRYTNN